MTWTAETARLDIGRSLTTIEDKYARLYYERFHHAADHELPGGDATVLLGPRADVEAFSYVRVSAVMGRLRLGHKDATRHQLAVEAAAVEHDAEDLEPPAAFLHGWANAIRADRGQHPAPYRDLVTTIAYLRNAIDWITATNDDAEPWWPAAETFVKDLGMVARKLEDVLVEGDRDDTGAPCLDDDCGGARLIKKWAGTVKKPLPATADAWQCPRCKRRYSDDEYRLACEQASRLYADRLTASDMLATYRVHPSTLRTWAARGQVRKRGRDDSGRMLYDVEDALKVRDTELAEETA